jgi:hypothetical protein
MSTPIKEALGFTGWTMEVGYNDIGGILVTIKLF